MQHWLSHFFGLDNGTGPFYLWWSGMGANFGEITVVGAALGLYYRHNCHVQGCWRVGRHHVPGTPYIACRRHHPTVPGKVTVDHIAAAHRRACDG